MNVADALLFTTVRITSTFANGAVSHGTGFLFTFDIGDAKDIPLLITNKHVVEDAVKGSFTFTKRKNDGTPDIGNNITIEVMKFSEICIMHPEKNIDLAAFPLATILESAKNCNKEVFTQLLGTDIIPNIDAINKLCAIEEILMIGYPNAIWDSKNNMPIVRRGITASNPKISWMGESIFLIDCACFPGSSGSPVFIYNNGAYPDSEGNIHMGIRVYLLGVLFAGPQHIFESKVIFNPQIEAKSVSSIPNNLGYVIKSEKILDFLPQILKIDQKTS